MYLISHSKSDGPWLRTIKFKKKKKKKKKKNNLKYFKTPQKISPRQARWHEFLQDYNFEITHFPGKSNTIADLLS